MPCCWVTASRGEGAMRGTVPGSLDEHAQDVCIAAWEGFDGQELRAARRIRANFNVFAVARFACVPDFDGIELEHVNLHSSYASGEEIPGASQRRTRGAHG